MDRERHSSGVAASATCARRPATAALAMTDSFILTISLFETIRTMDNKEKREYFQKKESLSIVIQILRNLVLIRYPEEDKNDLKMLPRLIIDIDVSFQMMFKEPSYPA